MEDHSPRVTGMNRARTTRAEDIPVPQRGSTGFLPLTGVGDVIELRVLPVVVWINARSKLP